MEKIAEHDTLYIYIALFLAAFILSWLISTFSEKAKNNENAGKNSKGLIGWLFTIIIFLLLLSAGLIFAFNNAYTAFTKEQIIATVECRPHRGADADFDLYLTLVIDGEAQTPQIFQIQGDQWELGGDILIWQNYMNFLGLHSMYRLTRVNGRYVHAKDETEKPQTIYSLTETEKNDFWENIYQNAVKIPFVDAAFVQSVASYPFYGDLFQITVTTGGYKAERLDGRAR